MAKKELKELKQAIDFTEPEKKIIKDVLFRYGLIGYGLGIFTAILAVFILSYI